MGVASGCGCKEVYRFPHITYPYSLVSVLFCSSIPTFCSFKKKVFRSCNNSMHTVWYLETKASPSSDINNVHCLYNSIMILHIIYVM